MTNQPVTGCDMDKMRQEFEAWFEADSMPLESDWFKRDEDGEYDHMPTYYAWRAWQASRAALCIELPDSWIGGEMAYDPDLMAAIDVKEALDQAGVSHK